MFPALLIPALCKIGETALWRFVSSRTGAVTLALTAGLIAGSVMTGQRYREADQTKDLRSQVAAMKADATIREAAAKTMESQINTMTSDRVGAAKRIADYEAELSRKNAELAAKGKSDCGCVYDRDLRGRLRIK